MLGFLVSIFAVSLVSAAVVVAPVSVTSTIAGDAGSGVNYLIGDNPGYTTEAPLQRPVGTSVTLPSGTAIADALATFHARSGTAHAESWTQKTESGHPVFVFDLTGGGDTNINSTILWQYGNQGGSGHIGENDTRDFRMIFHTESEGSSFNFGTETIDLTASMVRSGIGTGSNAAQQFSFDAITARYVAMIIDNNQGISGTPGPRYGLGEVRFGTTGDVPSDPNLDTDGDGLVDVVETNTGIYRSRTDTGSNPNNPNTDGDRIKDGIEVRHGTDPNDPNDYPDLPNVLFIMADDLGVGELGCYGQTKIVTPRIDQLSTQGICLDDFYAPCPVCAPTRAMLLTGKHAGQAAIRNNKSVGGYQTPLPPDSFTLGHLMQNAGYVTSCIGKWGLGSPNNSGAPNNQGFDHFFGYLDQVKAHYYYPQYLWRNHDKVYYSTNLAANAGTTVEIPGAHNEIGFIKSNDGNVHSQDAMTKETLEWITAHKDEAFFMYLCFPIPHTSIQPPGHIDDLTDADGIVIDNNVRTCVDEFYPTRPFGAPIHHNGTWSYTPTDDKRHEYAAMISAMDRDVGRIQDHLESLGLADDTLVFFTSDNGTTWITEVDSTYFNSVGNYRGLKEEVYDGGVRIPFVAWWPGHIPARTSHVKLLGSLDDIMATLAELTGTPCNPDTTGRSILPTLLGHAEFQESKPFVYHEFKDKNALPGHDHTWYWTRSIREANWKLHRYTVINTGVVKYELFNLETDPAESSNVYASNPAIVARLERMMDSAHTPSNAFFRNKDELPNSSPDIKADISYGTLGRRLNGTGYALDGLFKEVSSRVTFKTTIDTSGGTKHNGAFLFGEGTNAASFIQVEIDDDANTLSITHGGDTASTALSGNRPFHIEVVWDPATSTVTLNQGTASLSLVLTAPPSRIDHVGYSTDTAITDFAPVEISLDSDMYPLKLTTSVKYGFPNVSYKRLINSGVYVNQESSDIKDPANWIPINTFYEQSFNRFGGVQDVLLRPLTASSGNFPSRLFFRVLVER